MTAQPGGKRLRYTQKCNFCNYKFASEHDLLIHQLTHSEKHYSCDRCLSVFSKETQFERHRTVCTGGKKTHVCNDCGDVFRTGQQLDEHKRRVHQNSKIYECSSCDAKFSWHENLIRHERMHNAESCICKECGAIFGSSASVKVHLWKVHNQVLEEETAHAKPFTCNFCKKSFRFSKNFKMHVCGANGPRKDVSKTTTATTSSSVEKPYKCNVCGKSFKYDFSYEAHIKIHDGWDETIAEMKSYEPSLAATASALAAAASASVFRDTEDPERPHKCNVCGVGFKYDFSLMAHLKSHTAIEIERAAAKNGKTEKPTQITMAQFAQMIQHGLMNDDDAEAGESTSICIEPVDDDDGGSGGGGGGGGVEMYDFSEQEVTMLPVSQLPSGLLNLLFQSQDNRVTETVKEKLHKIPSSPSASTSDAAAAAAAVDVPLSSPPLSSSAPSASLTLRGGGEGEGERGIDAAEEDEQYKDRNYTIHSVILDGMRMTANPDEEEI